MRQSGNWGQAASLDLEALRHLLIEAIERLDVNQARTEVAPFVPDRRALEVWSREFFTSVTSRIIPAKPVPTRDRGSRAASVP